MVQNCAVCERAIKLLVILIYEAPPSPLCFSLPEISTILLYEAIEILHLHKECFVVSMVISSIIPDNNQESQNFPKREESSHTYYGRAITYTFLCIGTNYITFTLKACLYMIVVNGYLCVIGL